MTVDELRTALADIPGPTRVMVDGYEGGLSDPVLLPPSLVELNTIDSGVYGPHSLPGEGWTDAQGTALAIILSRNSR
jgi:hypothetical protein